MCDAGIADAELVSERYDARHFGNAIAVFRLGGLMVRFVRDRTQDFVDLDAASAPTKFHQFDDVDVMMGWKSLEEVMEKKSPEPLPSVLERLARYREELEDAFSEEHEALTRSQLEEATNARAGALRKRHRK